MQSLPAARFLYLTTKATKSLHRLDLSDLTIALFLEEKRVACPKHVLHANWERCLTIPMPNPKVRSLNLATAVGIVLYEALRQTGAFAS